MFEEYASRISKMTGIPLKYVKRYQKISLDEAIETYLPEKEVTRLIQNGIYTKPRSGISAPIEEIHRRMSPIEGELATILSQNEEGKIWVKVRSKEYDLRQQDSTDKEKRVNKIDCSKNIVLTF